jgi:hypothetical protein
MKVKLEDIIFAIETTDQYTENFLDLETGEVVFVNDMVMGSREKEEIYDQLDEHGFLRLLTSFDIREYDIMEEFITTLPSPVREKLSEAIIGKGAFRRFKDGINRYDVEREWYAYQEEAYKRIARNWCEENEVEYE